MFATKYVRFEHCLQQIFFHKNHVCNKFKIVRKMFTTNLLELNKCLQQKENTMDNINVHNKFLHMNCSPKKRWKVRVWTPIYEFLEFERDTADSEYLTLTKHETVSLGFFVATRAKRMSI